MNKKVKTVVEFMEEMGSIALENLENDVHREFINDTLKEARQCEAITQDMPQQLAALEAAAEDELQASILWEVYKKLTAEMNELAVERTSAQTALKSGFRAVMGMSDPQKAAAAALMFELMHKYDLHAGMNVDKQTAIIDSFIADVEENHTEEVALTGMTELYNSLKTWNQRVCDKVIERDNSAVGRGTGLMRNARLATDNAFRNFRRAVNAYAYVNDYTRFEHFIGHMNELIIRYKRVHLGQTASSPEAEPGETTPGEGGEQQPGEGEQQPTTPTEPTTPTKYNAVFIANGATVATQQYEAGAVIQAPEAPSGYEWEEFPYRMPEHDITVNAVRKNIPGGGGGSGFE